MRLRIIGGLDKEFAGLKPRNADSSEVAPIEASHALVPLASVVAAIDAPQAFRHAAFLAQLLAIRDQHPQTRTLAAPSRMRRWPPIGHDRRV